MLAAARGATLHWDGDATGSNNAASGAVLGGNGIWNLATSNWWNSGGLDTNWNNLNLDTAVFTGVAGTVSLGDPVTVVQNLVFNSSDYVLTGSPLTLNTNAVVNLRGHNGAPVNTTRPPRSMCPNLR